MKYKIFIVLICALSLFINLYQKNQSPPCFNADEAAFGYNAYSILKTGKDEHGNFLPLRLKSFNDYKMPLYAYLSIPFIALGGLNETSTRAVNSLVALLFPLIVILLAQELFKNKIVSLISGFILSLTTGLQIIGRQAHEGYLTSFLITLSFYLLIKILNNPNKKIYNFYYFISLVILSFGYQFSRLWLVLLFFICFVFLILKKVNWKFVLIHFLLVFLLLIPDLLNQPTRVGNLLIFTNQGQYSKTIELRNEGGSRIFYNKLSVSLKSWLFNYSTYFSPQFLITEGDSNKKFGYSDLSYITIVEYIFILVGLYYLFKNKNQYRFIILSGLLFAPIAGSLSWTGLSVTRSLPIFVFINLICGYGFYELWKDKKIIALMSLIIYFMLLAYSWDFYFNHYSKRAMTIRGWQCGNKEMASYVKNNYSKFDNFYITKSNSQPYIFLLFYFPINPEKYQNKAVISGSDSFGFSQVEKFDKFIFSFRQPQEVSKSAIIGFPEEFNKVNSNEIKQIKIGTEKMFWMYEKDKKTN